MNADSTHRPNSPSPSNTESAPQSPNPSQSASILNNPSKHRRRWFIGLGIGGILAGLFAWRHWSGAGWHHRNWHHDGWHGSDAAAWSDRAERKITRIMNHLGASSEQTEKARAIAREASIEIQPLAAAQRQSHQAFIEALSNDKVDRERIEHLRQETLQRADAATTRLAQAMGDLAETLTPAQRQRALDHLRRV